MPQFSPGSSAPFPGPSDFRLYADRKLQKRKKDRREEIDTLRGERNLVKNRVSATSVSDAQRGRPIPDADMKMLGTALRRRKEKKAARGY